MPHGLNYIPNFRQSLQQYIPAANLNTRRTQCLCRSEDLFNCLSRFEGLEHWFCRKHWIHTSLCISLVFQPQITFELVATKFLDEIAIVRIVLRSASAVVQQDLSQLFTPHLGPHDPRSSPRGGAAEQGL